MTSQITNKAEYRRLVDGRDCSGFLALDNFDEVVKRIRSMIGNGQPYTWVAMNESFGLRAEVRASMVAETVRTTDDGLDDGTPMSHLTVSDTYGVWGLSTTARDQAAARDGDKFNHTYLHFEHTKYGEKLTIEHNAPAGHRLCWVIAVEGGPS